MSQTFEGRHSQALHTEKDMSLSAFFSGDTDLIEWRPFQTVISRLYQRFLCVYKTDTDTVPED